MPKSYTFQDGPISGPLTTFRVTPAAQCTSKHWPFSETRCRGLKGHQGPHWCYREDGWFEQWKSTKDIDGPADWASSTTPPDHKEYIHPKDKLKDDYTSHHKRVKIKTTKKNTVDLPELSEKEIAKLEKLAKECLKKYKQ